jgi:D-amino peptidase
MFSFLRRIIKKEGRDGDKRPTILLYADMEGICQVSNWNEVTPGTKAYDLYRDQMTAEVNAAIAGAFAGGAGRVLVNDLHWFYNNLLWFCLDKRAEVRRGEKLVLDIFSQEKIDGIFMVGLHAMAHTPQAILPHTWALPSHFDRLYINEKETGEIGMMIYAGSTLQIPVLLVTADQAGIDEAKSLLQDRCEYVSVKEMQNNNEPIFYSGSQKLKEIKKAAKQAVKRLRKGQITYPVLDMPFRFSAVFPSSILAEKASGIRTKIANSISIQQEGSSIYFSVDSYHKGLDLFFDAVALAFE